jgi:hypothetical protein
MTNVKNMVSALVFALALAPLAGAVAFIYGTTQSTAYLATPARFNQLAANSKGRPAEFTPADQVAANSKGRPAEFTPANADQVAVNSKGRPSEFTPANEVAANSKGRPSEFNPAAAAA